MNYHNETMDNNREFSPVIDQVNEFTEITISPIDDKYEWYWRCKESEKSFATPELALLDAISFICRDYETLLLAALAKEEESESVDFICRNYEALLTARLANEEYADA